VQHQRFEELVPSPIDMVRFRELCQGIIELGEMFLFEELELAAVLVIEEPIGFIAHSALLNVVAEGLQRKRNHLRALLERLVCVQSYINHSTLIRRDSSPSRSRS
jgi:hypothetical protein